MDTPNQSKQILALQKEILDALQLQCVQMLSHHELHQYNHVNSPQCAVMMGHFQSMEKMLIACYNNEEPDNNLKI